MVKRSKEEWDKVLEELAQSGKSANSFCREKGISHTTLHYQKKSRQPQVINKQPAFTRVVTSEVKKSNQETLTLKLSKIGAEIEFPLSALGVVLSNLQRSTLC
jgi:hypothetical protein